MFVFNQKGELQVREVSERPEVVVQTINRGDWERYLPYELSPTQSWQAARVNHLVVVTPLAAPEDYPLIKLTPREFQTLQGLCSGKTAAQIAFQLHIQARSVHRHFNNLRAKFKSDTLPELLAKAAALDLVRPDLDDLFD
ncbi:MAG: LuxR C-terminal-related transcriptional regulator [Anaerolineaceae bacterium]|nr:LuxR C-terminal-related transcriptional regulator [Anaerolineaceae bacterium]